MVDLKFPQCSATTTCFVAFFSSSLVLYRLKLLQMLFVMVGSRAQAGEKCNYLAICRW